MFLQFRYSLFIIFSLFLVKAGIAESITNDLSSIEGLKAHNADISAVTYKGKPAIQAKISPAARKEVQEARAKIQASGVRPSPAAFESARKNHLVIVDDDFHNGTIEVWVSGEPASGANAGARGFVGVAFRLQEDLKTYDCFYIRPTNGRAEDQVRRNHSVQYTSHPEHTWYKLREDTPGKYESYVDLQPATWTKLKITVEGETARLYVHDSEQPTLIVNDLKTGPDTKGAVALWFEGSTLAHFSDLKITK